VKLGGKKGNVTLLRLMVAIKFSGLWLTDAFDERLQAQRAYRPVPGRLD
jgi:hypothetical protein